MLNGASLIAPERRNSDIVAADFSLPTAFA
jgi:hypothetical protein